MGDVLTQLTYPSQFVSIFLNIVTAYSMMIIIIAYTYTHTHIVELSMLPYTASKLTLPNKDAEYIY